MSHVSVSECCQELAEANAKPLEGSYPNHSKSICNVIPLLAPGLPTAPTSCIASGGRDTSVQQGRLH